MANTFGSPRRGHLRAADGALVGWRYWSVFRARPDLLISPFRKTRWEGPVLNAHAWSTDEAVEGVAGIHATHAQKQARCIAAMERTRRGWRRYFTTVAVGRVRGCGKYVIGVNGWRAQQVIVDKLFIVPFPGHLMEDVLEALAKRYDCPVHLDLRPDLRSWSSTAHRSCATCGHAKSHHRVRDGTCVMCGSTGPCAGEDMFQFAPVR
jgi:hypothetical protein